jgi:hypothetical protein
MQRVPTHEPWDQHENIDSAKYSAEATDIEAVSSATATNGDIPVANAPITPAPTSEVPEDWTQDKAFIDRIKLLSISLGCTPIDMLACMAFETGRTYKPDIRNSIGATGLIQFIPRTAADLGTTTDYLASLTRAQQCDWVEKYFKKGPLRKVANPSLEDLYMAILYPVAVGKPNDWILFKAGTKQYSQNNGLDIGKKGYITKQDAATKVREQIPYVNKQLAKAGITL